MMNSPKPKVFIFDEDNDIKSSISPKKCITNSYNDYKSFLLDINMGKVNSCEIGFIHQNGSVSLASFLKNYIQSVNPNIKLMIYKNEIELKNLLSQEKLV